MNSFTHQMKMLLCGAGLLATALLAACGGGDQGRDPILGLPSASLVAVVVTPATASIPSGGVQQFVATASYSDGASRDVSAAAAWTSATVTAATINSSGAATGIAAGTSVISAAFGGKSGTATLTVTPATLASIAVTPATPSIPSGATQQFVATGTYTDGSTRDITAISAFTSLTPAVASVTAAGRATGLTAGTSTISASSGIRTGSAQLTVTAVALTSIAITPVNPAMQTGTTRQLLITGTFSDNSTRDLTATSTFVSATPAVATVNAAGLVSAATAGTAVVTATSAGKTATTTVTVNTPALNSITVTPPASSVGPGGTQAFVATANYADGTTANISNSATWTSSNTAIATVLPTGVATAISAGNTVITAASAGKSGTATFNVVQVASLTSIVITPANSTVALGTAPQLTATGVYSNGTTADLSGSVGWSSSAAGVATVSQAGVANTLALGVTNVTASLGSLSATTSLTVTAVVVVTPPVVALPVNLRSAATFGVLAGNSITNNSGGTTLVTGDVGSPSQTVDPVQTAGYTNYKSGAILATALGDLQLAITDASARTCTVTSAAGIDLGGLVFTPGVYCYAGAISITGTFTMNGPGVYVFRTASTLNTTANSIVAFVGGATADNLSWVPAGATTLGANSVFKGSILAQSAAITLGDNAALQGRVLSASAATLRNNVIVRP